ncbi:MAG: hypothetical protein WC121_07375 [Candidatus Kapaibacterium sp.]
MLIHLVLVSTLTSETKQIDEVDKGILINSVLRVPFLSGMVKSSDNKFECNFSFDLHGFDCSAPDCYTTNLKFIIPILNPLNFPNEIDIEYSELGCGIDSIVSKVLNFKLIEENSNYLNYYSVLESSYLFIFKEDKHKEYVYYFPNTMGEILKISELDSIIKNYNDNVNLVPNRISKIVTLDYEDVKVE